MNDTVAGAPRTASRSRTRRLSLGSLALAAPAAVVIILLFVIPLGRMIASSFTSTTGFALDRYVASLDPAQDIFANVLLRTTIIAFLVTVCCAVIGYAVAYTAVKLPGSWSVALIAVVCLPFFTSALIRTYAWQVILGNNGPINQALQGLGITDAPIRLVYNDIGVVIGMTQVLLPMMVFPLYSAMRGIDKDLDAAARSLGSSGFRAWRTVYLPLSLPGVAAGAALVFIVSLGYYTTPTLLQGPSTPMFAQRIDTLASIPGSMPLIAAQSTLVLIACVVLLLVFRRPLGFSGPRTDRASARAHQTHALALRDTFAPVGTALGRVVDTVAGLLAVPVRSVLSLLAIVISVGPVIVIATVSAGDSSFLQFPIRTFSLRWYEAVFRDREWADALVVSLTVSLIAAVLAAIAGATASFLITRTRRQRFAAASYALLVSPLVVPQIVVAIALLTFFLGLGVTGTPVALVLGYVIITLPLVMILMTTAFRSLDPLYERASSSLGARPLQTAQWVLLPLVIPSVAGAMLFAFVTAFSDLVMAQFLGGPQAQTLERLIYQDIRESVSPEVAAVGTLLIAFVLLLAVLAVAGQRVFSRRVRA